jgi:hypothetical protein
MISRRTERQETRMKSRILYTKPSITSREVSDATDAAITPRTRAILAVHIHGNMCDMSAPLAIGERNEIPIVEDAAEALGSVEWPRGWFDRSIWRILFSWHQDGDDRRRWHFRHL